MCFTIVLINYEPNTFMNYSQNVMASNKLSSIHSYQRKCTLPRTQSPRCRILFQGKEIITDPLYPSDIGRNRLNECSLEELIKDCPKLRSEHGYEDKPVSNDELDFPLAFSIKMHANSPQVERLLRTIYRPHNFYCIHVDSKASDETYDLIKGVADCLKNVVILPKRFNVVYSSIHLVAIEFACMKLCMESGVKWKYYINLTGQEFLLRTNLELVEILKIFNGTNDIEGYPLNLPFRIKEKFVISNHDLVSIGINSPFKYNTSFYKGSAYGMFSRDFVNFVLTDNFVSEFYQWLHTTYAPEETIWSTLNRLPFTPGGYPISNIKHDDYSHASRAIIWRHDRAKCHGKYVHGSCIFKTNDLPWLHSRPEVVANKFYEDLDYVVLDCLEEWVNDRTYSSSLEGLDWYYYRNLPQVKYHKRFRNIRKIDEFFQARKEVWLKKYGPH